MPTPVAPPAPAAPADAGTTPAAPKSLADIQRGMKSVQGRQADAPSQGSFVKVGGKTMASKQAPVAPKMDAPATAGEKAAAPVEAKPEAPAPEAAPEAPKVDAHAELKKAFDAKSRELADLKKRTLELEELGSKDFDKLVLKMAEHYKADPQKVAEKLLLERAQKWEEEQRLAQMSPEQREYYELKRDAEARKVSDAKAAEKAKTDAVEARGRQTYESTTSKLIEAHKLLPESIRNHPEFNGRAALRVRDRMLALAEAADPNMPADQFLASIDPAKLAAEAWADHQAELKQALLAMDDGALDEFLDEKLAARWTAKLQAAAVKKAHPALTAQPRAGDGKFVAGSKKPDPRPLSAMKPTWSNFLPKK